MTDELINQLSVQIARLENRIDALETTQGEEQGDSFDDLYLRMETGGGGGEPQGAFRIDDGKVVDCHFLFGRTTVTINDFTLDGDGLYSLSIPHSSYGSATIVKNTSDVNSLTQTIIPLFRISNGSVVADYRGMPVIPVRE